MLASIAAALISPPVFAQIQQGCVNGRPNGSQSDFSMTAQQYATLAQMCAKQAGGGGQSPSAPGGPLGQALGGIENALQKQAVINQQQEAIHQQQEAAQIQQDKDAAVSGIQQMGQRDAGLQNSADDLRARLRALDSGADMDADQSGASCDKAWNSCEAAESESSALGDYDRERTQVAVSLAEGVQETAGDAALDAAGDLTGDAFNTEGVAGDAITALGTEAGNQGADANETKEAAQKQLDDEQKCEDKVAGSKTDLIQKAAAQDDCIAAANKAFKEALNVPAGFGDLYSLSKTVTDAAENALGHYEDHLIDSSESLMKKVAGCSAAACVSQ